MTKTRKTTIKKSPKQFGESLGLEQLNELVTDLQSLRNNPPFVTVKPGKREGDILGFVRGLRLSARLTYFLRERFSHTEYEVNWGHLLDANLASCSPECDVVIHEKGHHRKWNGGEQPIMDFRFILASRAKVVVSCKSTLSSIDIHYPAALKAFGVKKVFLFAECCEESRLAGLEKSGGLPDMRGCAAFTSQLRGALVSRRMRRCTRNL